RVWAPKKPGLRVDEPGALPVRPDEKIHLEARLNRPAYVYLIWLTGRGEIDTLYPWDRPTGSLPARLIPTAVVESPPELDRGWPLEGSSGLETGLLLARSTPLPADVRLRDLLGPVDPSPLRDPLEVAVLGFGGQLAAPIIRESHRGLGAEAERVDEPLLRLIERLRPHFEVVRAVRFAYQAD
ncbi:MAG TPA: hypothetical protein VF590_11860, partial [Isosphaeraceae bacterium]